MSTSMGPSDGCSGRRSPLRWAVAGLVLALLAAPSAADSPATDLSALLDDCRGLSPADQGIEIHERAAQIGHLAIQLDQGTLFPLRTSKGLALGFFFAGAGHYAYASEDPADRRVIAQNVARETRAAICYNGTLRDTFKRLVVFSAAPQFGELWSGPFAGADPANDAVVNLGGDRRSDFDRLWKRIEEGYLRYDHLAATARLNGPPRQYVYAEFEGGQETAGYSYDRMRDFEERFFLFRKVQGRDIRGQRPLSHQLIEGGPATHRGDLALRDIRIDISTEDNRTAAIRSDLSLAAGHDGIRVAVLDLVNNRDPDHFNWASSENRLTLQRVMDDSGRVLAFSHRYDEVLVQLPNPLTLGQEQRLRFETQGDVLTDWHGRRHDNFFDLAFDAWYPRPPTGGSAGFTSSLKIRTRGPFQPLASGQVVARREEGGFRELETRSPATPGGPVVFAGKYTTREEKVDDVMIRSNAYADAMQEVQDKMPRVAAQFLLFYRQWLGPYPFGTLDIIEIPEFLQEVGEPFHSVGIGWGGFGVAPPGLVLMTSDAYNPYKIAATMRGYRDLSNAYTDSREGRSSGEQSWRISRGVNARLAHEIAHQWFPHQAMPASRRDVWLSESFAEYLSGLAMGAVQPDARQAEGFPQRFAEWQYQAKACRDAGALEMAALLSGPDAGRDYACLVYNRGPLVLHMLRALAGNDGFFAILRKLLDRGKAGPVTTDDFRQATEAILQVDMGWFFDQWVRQGGIPEIRLRYAVEQRGGKYLLTGRAEQADGPAFKKVHIPFVLEMDGGRKDLRLLFQDQPVKDFSFDLPDKPKNVAVDPTHNNLAVYH